MILPENFGNILVQIFEEFGCVRQILTFFQLMVRPETRSRVADYLKKTQYFSFF
jgi:hypothetical protein